MKTDSFASWMWRVTFVMMAMVSIGFSEAIADGKIGVYGIYMEPRGADAENYSQPGCGAGAHVVVPVPQLSNLLAGVAGVEVINLLSETVEIRDEMGWRRELHTSQNYARVYIGPQVGPHGKGFFRPHAGLNLALVMYDITTDLVEPDDYDPEKEKRQNLQDETKIVFGYDFTLGIDLNFFNKIAVDGGVRYVKSFSVPQQLGEGSEKVHPEYFQIYLGAGVTFDFIKDRMSQ
jgi:hypothetical protein